MRLRGAAYELRHPRGALGHEQQRNRYAVLVQTTAQMTLSTVLVAPTSTSAGPAVFRPEIDMLGLPTRVLVEQTTAVDWTRLGAFAGVLSVEEMQAVDAALSYIFDIT